MLTWIDLGYVLFASVTTWYSAKWYYDIKEMREFSRKHREEKANNG